jgi:hypothetical protein
MTNGDKGLHKEGNGLWELINIYMRMGWREKWRERMVTNEGLRSGLLLARY